MFCVYESGIRKISVSWSGGLNNYFTFDDMNINGPFNALQTMPAQEFQIKLQSNG